MGLCLNSRYRENSRCKDSTGFSCTGISRMAHTILVMVFRSKSCKQTRKEVRLNLNFEVRSVVRS